MRKTALTVAVCACCVAFGRAQSHIQPMESALRAAVANGGRITFNAGGTIVLSSPLIITADTVIDAETHKIIFSGGGNTRVLQISAGVKFELDNVIVEKGYSASGGGLLNDGAVVTLRGCTFMDNVARGEDGAVGANGTNAGPNGQPGLPGADGVGGAIASTGHLFVFDCSFRDNSAIGGKGGTGGGGADQGDQGWPGGNGGSGGDARGGAIANAGTPVLSNGVFANNTARSGDGGSGGSGGVYGGYYAGIAGDGGIGGDAGTASGGAIFASGVVDIRATEFSANNSDGGAGGKGGVGGGLGFSQGGDSGSGGRGGIAFGGSVHFQEATAIIKGAVVSDSSANGGSGGDGARGGSDLLMGQQGHGGTGGDADGAAMSISGGSIAIVECTLRKNNGAGGPGGTGADAFDFSGGRFLPTPGGSSATAGAARGTVFNAGTVTISGTTIAENSLRGGDGARGGNGGSARTVNGSNAGGGGGGGDAVGAGICTRGTVIAVNSTIALNSARAGNGGPGGRGGEARFFSERTFGGSGGNGGNAFGGGIAIEAGTASLQSITIATNAVQAQPGGAGGAGSSVGSAVVNGATGLDGTEAGANFFVANACALSFANTIFAGSAANGGGSGNVTDAGANICSDSSCGFTQLSLNNTDPLLGALDENGGPTPTMALREGSPAIDAANADSSPPTDQRGFARPAGTGPDIGAFERNATPSESGAIGFTVSGRITDGTNGIAGLHVHLGKQTTVTDENGAYRFVVAEAKRYLVRPVERGYRFKPAFRRVRVRDDVTVPDFTAKQKRPRR